LSIKVIVYTQPTCPPCHEEKNWLTEHGIAFEERNIRANDAYFSEAINLGAHSTPVTLIEKNDSERKVIHGFDKDALKDVLGIAE